MLRFDLAEFEQAARRLGGAIDQVPFAISKTLNDAAFAARSSLIDTTWARHVQVRNRNFLRNALRVERSDKRSLKVAVTTEGTAAGNRAHLAMHDKGGIKRARGLLAIPDAKILGRRGAKGMTPSLRPKALANSFRKGDAIYQRVGKGKRKKLRLLYTLKASAPIKADVPFTHDFEMVMRREIKARFADNLARAMRTRR